MSISFEKLRITLKSVGVPVTRDKAEQGKKMASSKVHRRMPYYQISFYTTGTEKDLIALENALEEAGIPYTDFVGIQGDENDDTVTNFYTYVRCIEDGK